MLSLAPKLARLIRHHRQNVFAAGSGDAHHRAILRLKRTRTWLAMMARNEGDAAQRAGERFARMGY